MIDTLLDSLGLTQSEKEIYLYLLPRGKVGAGEIIKNTSVKRGTVYNNLRRLIELGIIEEIKERDPSVFVALSPLQLDVMLKDEEKQLTHRKLLLEESLPELLSLYQSHERQADVTVHRGEAAVARLFSDIAAASTVGNEIRLIASNNVRRGAPAYFEPLVSISELKVISPVPIQLPGEHKHISDSNFSGDVLIGEGFVIFVDATDEPVATKISDRNIASHQLSLFENAWQLAK